MGGTPKNEGMKDNWIFPDVKLESV
jgi:hypothetical protein